jgi:hypothetical protein
MRECKPGERTPEAKCLQSSVFGWIALTMNPIRCNPALPVDLSASRESLPPEEFEAVLSEKLQSSGGQTSL